MSEKIKFFFLLGRPGCGKSYLYKNVFIPSVRERGIGEWERMDDFPVLQKLLDEDRDFKRHVRKDGGFQVTDFTIVDDVLKQMDAILRQKEKDGKIIMAEFARDDYMSAMRNFSGYVRDRSLLIYIWAPFDACMDSNRKRFENSKNIDDHIVPEDLMRTYYRTDDLEKLALSQKGPAKDYDGWNLVVFNNSDRDMSPRRKQRIFLDAIKGYEL
ncbi:MAG: hypothetical protein JXJ19_10060 [Elusimicrobia bacterium]|nr:hypothetical protein [Elusimicrobiota bacterium]